MRAKAATVSGSVPTCRDILPENFVGRTSLHVPEVDTGPTLDFVKDWCGKVANAKL